VKLTGPEFALTKVDFKMNLPTKIITEIKTEVSVSGAAND